MTIQSTSAQSWREFSKCYLGEQFYQSDPMVEGNLLFCFAKVGIVVCGRSPARIFRFLHSLTSDPFLRQYEFQIARHY